MASGEDDGHDGSAEVMEEVGARAEVAKMGTATGAVSLTWTSRSGDEGGDGRVYVDGSDVAACLDIGDEVKMSAEGAPRLLLYDKAGDAATTE